MKLNITFVVLAVMVSQILACGSNEQAKSSSVETSVAATLSARETSEASTPPTATPRPSPTPFPEPTATPYLISTSIPFDFDSWFLKNPTFDYEGIIRNPDDFSGLYRMSGSIFQVFGYDLNSEVGKKFDQYQLNVDDDWTMPVVLVANSSVFDRLLEFDEIDIVAEFNGTQSITLLSGAPAQRPTFVIRDLKLN